MLCAKRFDKVKDRGRTNWSWGWGERYQRRLLEDVTFEVTTERHAANGHVKDNREK